MKNDINQGEKNVLGAFAVLIILTIGIGIIGIAQINDLSLRIEKLGKYNLLLEKAILEMKINNTVYAMGIRNYVFWKVSHYLGAVSMAINLDDILAAEQRFREQLNIYKRNSYDFKQIEWAGQIGGYFTELSRSGNQIIELIGRGQTAESDENIKNLLMLFENRVYNIDNFLDNTMGKENLNVIEQQLVKTESDKRNAVLFLALTLTSAVLVGTFIALTVYRHRKRDRKYRQRLFNQLINLEENERKTLSAEIHDQMGQDLSGLKIYLGIIEQNIAAVHPHMENPQQDIKDKLGQCRKIVSGLVDKSHNIAYLLRPPALDEVGLVESVEVLLLDYKRLTGINYTYQKPRQNIFLPPEYSLLLYRISQELLTNMAKHSKAKNVSLSLNKGNGYVEFFYRDDGVGFQYDMVNKQPKRRREDMFKIGLIGLKERVELLDGAMRVDSAPGRGTKVAVRLGV